MSKPLRSITFPGLDKYVIEATPVTDTASGSIASFSDGSDGIPVRELSVNIEPSQDLHGYSNPWPGGGNINKLPSPTNATQTVNGITIKVENGVYTISGTASASAEIIFDLPTEISISTDQKTAFLNDAVNSGVTFYYRYNYTNYGSYGMGNSTNRVWEHETAYSSVNKIRFLVSSGTTVSTMHISPMLMDKTLTNPTSFTPYSNICPITGWDEVKVTRAGKNLVDGVSYWNNANYITDAYDLNPGTYTFSFVCDVHAQAIYVRESTMTGTTIQVVYNKKETTFTLTKRTPVMFQLYRGNAGENWEGHPITDVQLEVGSTATAYEPYQGITITIPLGSTVYGGTLDVITGELTIDRRYLTFSSFVLYGNYGIDNKPLYYANIPESGTKPIKTGANMAETPLLSNYFKYTTGLSAEGLGDNEIRTQGGSNPGRIYFRADAYNGDINAVNADLAATPLQVVAELITPTTVQLTPQQMTTLLGQNNIFADAGDVDVTYVADTKKYIAKMIANALNA